MKSGDGDQSGFSPDDRVLRGALDAQFPVEILASSSAMIAGSTAASNDIILWRTRALNAEVWYFSV